MFRRCIEWAATIANRETYNSIRQLSPVKCCNLLAAMLAYGAAAADLHVSSRSWDTSRCREVGNRYLIWLPDEKL